MPRWRSLTDLTLPDGSYIQAGSEYETDANYRPPTHGCQPIGADSVEIYWNEGPRLSDVEIWRQCFTNCNRWVGLPAPPPTTWWVKVDKGYVLRGAENLGVRPPM